MALIELAGVTKTYPNGVHAVRGVDLTVDIGSLLVVVGPSGCGKSTLLRLVAGLEQANDGDISIGGKRVNDMEPAERNIAMVFQNYALYPHMTVRRNLAYGLVNRKVPADEIETRVNAAAAALRIEQLLDRLPRQLSGGQRQRVAMGRAIVRRPQAYLFDEPLSNLDAKLRTRMRLEIKRLQRREGVTSLYVTHDQVEAMTLGDRLLLMRDGLVEQAGVPADLYHRPATVFVAEFIGSPAMNLIEAEAADGAVKLNDGTTCPFPQLPASAGSKLMLGLRPQDAIMGKQDGCMALTMRVELVEALGSDNILHGSLPGGEQFAVQEHSSKPVAPDTSMEASFPLEKIHLFDAASGKRIEDWPRT